MGNFCYINHSGKYIEIDFNMKIPFQLALQFSFTLRFLSIQNVAVRISGEPYKPKNEF